VKTPTADFLIKLWSLPIVALALSTSAIAQEVQTGATLIYEVSHGISPALQDIPPASGVPEDDPGVGRNSTPGSATPPNTTSQEDVALLGSTTNLLALTGLLSFNGIANTGYTQPDANGAVGATQFVEWANAKIAVYSKTNGTLLLGPINANSLWQSLGGQCTLNNAADGIVLYDKAANQWIIHRHAGPVPYQECIAVSTTSDATGTWHLYDFQLTSEFPDYTKLGVWPDAFYLSSNLLNPTTFAPLGAQVCALDRASMLVGAPASAHCFTTASNFQTLLPADLDGTTPPPAGSPNYLLNLATNSLDLWRFHVDFTNPANSTLTGPINIPVASFNRGCGGGVCIPQQSTTQRLDSLGDRLMYRLAYRNFGTHESLVVSHAVNTHAGQSVGVRWYEIRSPGSTPVKYQGGTFSPDTNYRWMSSMAMDKVGDIFVGYSVSSSSMYPATRVTGRVPTDPLGTLDVESTLIAGGGAQLPSNGRWGDYTSMAVDPVDDCTFWYVNEFYPTSSTKGWTTRIAAVKFTSCQ
jgi:hypothetical protein